MSSTIHIIPSADIARNKWDDCIYASSNAMIYAFSYYLDHMADNWTGLVLNNYEAVMPIPWRKKMGIRYCYAVPFVQQLGWFAASNILEDGIFPTSLLGFVKYGGYAFNYSNNVNVESAENHANYIIDLSLPYAAISDNYKEDAVNNIKKANRCNLSYGIGSSELAIQSYRYHYGQRLHNVLERDYTNFAELVKLLEKKKQAFARCVIDKSSGNVLSVALFLKDARRIYNIMNSTTGEGRKKAANHFLLDNVLKEFAGSGLVFDFEGSDIPGIKAFYEKFGAANQPYKMLTKFNNLPFPLSLLKG